MSVGFVFGSDERDGQRVVNKLARREFNRGSDGLGPDTQRQRRGLRLLCCRRAAVLRLLAARTGGEGGSRGFVDPLRSWAGWGVSGLFGGVCRRKIRAIHLWTGFCRSEWNSADARAR